MADCPPFIPDLYESLIPGGTGAEALELVEQVESLGSRIPLRLRFDHFVADEVPENLRLYHPMYAQLSDAELGLTD